MPSLFDLPFDEPPAPAPSEPPARRIYTVSELTAEIRQVLEGTWFEVWVEGELSNCKVWGQAGHLYLTLKDDRAQIKGFMFRSDVRRLKFKPEDGLRVIARGRLSVYEPKGEYQLTCTSLEPRGLGALQLAFEQLKRKLQDEGLFDQARKRPLPLLPRKIGVVTSIDGAAVRDVITVLRQRYPNVHVVIRPARVQGEGAAEDIARALAQLAAWDGVEVVILARGGGSIEDLWAFNEERVARAIAAAPVPVIAGIGHETDVTIADFVADLRAATPSNAAELVVARKDEFVAGIDRRSERAATIARGVVYDARRRLDAARARPGLAGFGARLATRGRHCDELARAVVASTRGQVDRRNRQLQECRRRLEGCDPRRRLAQDAARLTRLDGRLHASIAGARHTADRRFRDTAGRLDALSPLAVLARGYAVCWNADRTAIVREADAALVGRAVTVTLARGELDCTVVETRPARAGGIDHNGRDDTDV
jgi:exodeoxyribonuclease VII large subunit